MLLCDQDILEKLKLHRQYCILEWYDSQKSTIFIFSHIKGPHFKRETKVKGKPTKYKHKEHKHINLSITQTRIFR